MKKVRMIALLLVIVMLLAVASGFAKGKEQVVIYISDEQSYIKTIHALLSEQFPDYDIVMEYIPTGQQAARLMAEGTSTECDITMELTYNYLHELEEAGILADLSDIVDFSKYSDNVNQSSHYSVKGLLLGTVVVNAEMLEELGLPEPESYEDLLDPMYEGLIVMADPRTSGTGYMFLKSLVNAWGEEEAFDYFEKLSGNIVQFTTAGSGVINSMVQKEAAIGLGMVFQAADEIEAGEPLKMLPFEEGAPYTLYGQAIIAGKEERDCVREVFQYITTGVMDFFAENYPVRVFNVLNDKAAELPGSIPEDFSLSDMSNDTAEEQDRLLSMWTITG